MPSKHSKMQSYFFPRIYFLYNGTKIMIPEVTIVKITIKSIFVERVKSK